MKKLNIIILFLVSICIVCSFNGCKKGEKDPFLSIRTRDARLTQKWILKKVEGSYTTTTVEINKVTHIKNATITFDGTTFTEISSTSTSIGSGTPIYEYDTLTYSNGSFEITLKEHGIFDYIEKYKKNEITNNYSVASNFSNTGDGGWQWAESSKKKDHVAIQLNSGKLFTGGVYYIYKLSRKEMILKSSNYVNSNNTETTTMSNITSDPSNTTNQNSNDFTYTFESK